MTQRHWNKRAGANLNSPDVRGKHTANPGYKPGDWWVECQRCGCDIYGSEAVEDGYMPGLVVCPDCKDLPHPQDYVRGQEDKIMVDGPVTGESELAGGTDIEGTTVTFNDEGVEGNEEVPAGTFNQTDPIGDEHGVS